MQTGNDPIRAVVVDDSRTARELLVALLQSSAGIQVVGTAPDGAEALRIIKRLRPDVVTMDIVMPEKNGIEALKDIRAIDGGAKIIICSALGQESLIMEALEAGAQDFIVKPFKPPKVRADRAANPSE